MKKSAIPVRSAARGRVPSKARCGRRWSVLVVWVLTLGLAASAAAARSPASRSLSSVRIAVAPFAGESTRLPASAALAGRLARRDLERLIEPGSFVAQSDFDAPAAEVRRWAYHAAVDAVVVGRIVGADGKPARADSGAGLRVEAALRSGHTGAELARHTLPLAGSAALGAVTEQLAESLLIDLGVAPEAARATAPPPVPAENVPAGAVPVVGAPRSARGLEGGLALPGFRGDAPIEIKAEEAEIVDREDRRRIVFQRDVHVRQGNFSLQSQRLEAEYRQGESEPTRLVARGQVRVDQADRHAECDRAVYVRATRRISCEGRAQLIQGCDIVRGERIDFDLEDERARVRGAASIVIRPDGSDPGVAAGPTAACSGQEAAR